MAARKRSAAEVDPGQGRRRSGRISSTPQKSKYFQESESEDREDDAPPPRKRGRPSKAAASAGKKKKRIEKESDDEDEYNEDEKSEEDQDDGDEYNDEKPGEEEDGDDDEDEDEDDEDAPPKVRIVPLEKMRDTGGVEYEDNKIHKNTLLFLKDLKVNNKRSWLKSHDGEYRRALKDWESFVDSAMLTAIDVDETIPELPVKDVIFRIHRDIRFSKDPTPYKPHFSAAFSRTGRKGPYACYYIHCEPKSSFIGGGLWCPDKDQLAKLRRSIDRHPERWREVLNTPALKRIYLPGVKPSADDEKAIEAFFDKNQSNALKKKPMGFDADHRDIKLLRLRNFTLGTKIDESSLASDTAQEKVAECFRGLEPFVSFLNDVVMPDPNPEESEDEEEEGE
ncbi:unnamed protein product [Clonostachys rhizophaga]|uniref:Uncharacterized protein n=1 Tax=Clonostachys rhizophaga TaxID=160324 RepID=A0A9N9V862_9HYPO|nr:unnamed protein product [Clonostachys rhizophaga]